MSIQITTYTAASLNSSGVEIAGTVQPDAEAIQAWLVSHVSEALKVSTAEIDACVPFANYGMSSMAAVSLSGDLEDWLGRPLPATIMWDYPTINALAEHLAATSDLSGNDSK